MYLSQLRREANGIIVEPMLDELERRNGPTAGLHKSSRDQYET